jgi:serine/threonine protein kinase/tetratricopeptide (TPR) repeat protein
MPAIAMTNRTCRKCGANLFPEAARRFCAACLLETGLGPLGDEDEEARESASPMLKFGEYELLEEIGRGGQGVVYRARQESLNRIVALKVIGLGHWASELHLKRFRLEAEAAARLDHPGIVPIYEIGERDGACYFSMKFVEGGSLDEVVRREPLSLGAAAKLLAKVARIVHYAHEHGVLHRDIKPGNILLDKENEPHLTDFGLARVVEKESNVTGTMDVLGTPSYMAPEQAAGGAKALTASADVYGLGAVFYQLLTGQPPFAGGTTYETIRLVMETEPRRPSLWNKKVDRDLETICRKCLEKDPAKRYPTALSLADDLERWLGHEPVQARRSGIITRSRKWVRRHPIAVISTAAAMIVAGAICLSVWQSIARRQESASLPNSLTIVFRSASLNDGSSARECSRDLNHLLSQLSSMKVTPRSQVLRWETSDDPPGVIAKAIGTRLILLGTLEVGAPDASNDLMVELFDARRGEPLWRHRWKGQPAGWSSARTQIVREIAGSLGLVLSEQEQSLLRRPLTANQSALAEYFSGRREIDVLTEASLVSALAHFEKAVQLDARFAQAYAGLAGAHIAMGYTFQNPVEHFGQARSEIDTALALDPDLPEAKIADGLVKYFYEWDWAGAQRAVEQALVLDPSMVEADACYLHSLDVLGRTEDPLQRVQRAVALHPASIAIRSELGCAAYYAGQFDKAVNFYADILKMDPENPMLYWGLGRTQAQQQLWPEALATLRAGQGKPGGDWSGLEAEIAYTLAQQGRTEEAREIIGRLRVREQTQFVDPYLFALIYAGLGDSDEVFNQLGLACEKKSPFIPTMPVDPKLLSLHHDPRFRQILERLKFPPRLNAMADR